MVRVILIFLVIGFLLSLAIVFSDRSRKEKAIGVTVFWAIPLAILAVYHFFYRSEKRSGLPKDWESK